MVSQPYDETFVKQIAQYQDGRLELQEVPQPVAPPGGILVRTTHSVISVGTEKMKVEQAKMNLLQKAKARPDQVRKVLDTAKTLGWKSAMDKVRNRLETPTPLGYSASGIVEAVDPVNTRFKVGDRVSCSGAECAFHAEYNALPDLLAAKVPDGVPNWKAAYTTLAAIALQAVRQTRGELGDRVLVMGQGLVGLLVTNLLACSGMRVMALDLLPSRRSFSLNMGAEEVVIPGEEDLMDSVRRWTDGFGVDQAVICTSTQSNQPIESAADALRDRGRLIDVGITKIELPWKKFYEKELDVRFSRSYGPGRYDPQYEWRGHDYPIGYVRWTEQRNFDACLHLMKQSTLKLEALTTRHAAFSDAIGVYDDLMKEGCPEIGVVLEYDSRIDDQADHGSAIEVLSDVEARGKDRATPSTQAVPEPRPELDVIGAGNFARTMLLPHMKGSLTFNKVVNQTALSARHVSEKFGFKSAETNSETVFDEPGQSALLIATRHNLHASLVLEGLKNDRHVFVEKPLCLSIEELEEIDRVGEQTQGSVMIGFNRRFAPAARRLKALLNTAQGPISISYRVHPGALDPSHWYADYEQSGGRVLGEACHFLDFFCFLTGSPARRVLAQTTWPPDGRTPFPDSVSAQVEFRNGSSGQLVYSAEGDSSFPKERITVSAPGLVAEIENFQKLTIYKKRKKTIEKFTSKGHAEEMKAWSGFLNRKADHPLPYCESRKGMVLTFAVLQSIQSSSAVSVLNQESA